MQLKNQQNNSSLISQITNLEQELRRNGQDPKKLAIDIMNQRGFSQSDFDKLKQQANKILPNLDKVN